MPFIYPLNNLELLWDGMSLDNFPAVLAVDSY